MALLRTVWCWTYRDGISLCMVHCMFPLCSWSRRMLRACHYWFACCRVSVCTAIIGRQADCLHSLVPALNNGGASFFEKRGQIVTKTFAGAIFLAVYLRSKFYYCLWNQMRSKGKSGFICKGQAHLPLWQGPVLIKYIDKSSPQLSATRWSSLTLS